MKKYVLLVTTLCALLSAKSQNLILNSAMNGITNWNNGGCAPEMGPETDYGGPTGANNVTEIDLLTCIQQTVGITPGSTYTINFGATRRTNCDPFTPASPGIKVKVTGVTSGTVYSSVDYHYSNVTWTGFTNQAQVFGILPAATDAQVRIDITSIDNPEGCGIIVDNVTMVFTSALPVSLVSFNAAAKNNAVDLSWVTLNEVNNGYFIVYRSKNGINFDEIGRVNANGFSTGATYTLTDAQPGTGVNYYRLKQVDRSGANKSSGIIKVNLNSKNLDVFVYPTIVTDMLNYVVQNPNAEKLRIAVSDISGKRISNSVVSFTTGTTQKSINVNNLASGIYLLTISDETNTFKKSITFKKN